MVSAKMTVTRPRATKLKATEAEKNRKFRQKLAKMFRSRRFIIIVLVIAVFDMLLVASELINDILAVIKEESELCNTENILIYLNATHASKLDEYFQEYNAEEIMEQLEGRNSYLLRLHKRDIESVTLPRSLRLDASIGFSTTIIPTRPSNNTRKSTTTIPARSGGSTSLPTTAIPARPGDSTSLPITAIPVRPGDSTSLPTTAIPVRPGDSTSLPTTTILPRTTNTPEKSTTPDLSRPSDDTIQTKTSASPRPTLTDTEGDSTTPDHQRTTGTTEQSTTGYSLIHPSDYSSSSLFKYAFICDSWSTAVMTLVCFMKIAQITIQGKGFLVSKLQVLDAIVVAIFLPTDFGFLPARIASNSIVLTTLPMILDVVSRVIRVVICSLVVLQAQDREMLKVKREELKKSVKQHRCFKKHVRNLQRLAREHGAEESQLIACKKQVYTRKRRESNATNGILSLNRLLFLAAPLSYPNKNQHIIDEEEKEERMNWVHPTTSFAKIEDASLNTINGTAANAEEILSRSSGSYESEDEEEDEEEEIVEDLTDYSTLDSEEHRLDLVSDEDYITTYL
ncbi:uncharacterized protein [Watersipora subatra]|uniref:uncharacterized protein n=1 Tax=Watersipora subatra TaxID=2589382 RepID=UPI00355BC9BE